LSGIESIDGVCEVETFGPDGTPGEAPALLIEVPHGATRGRDFDRVRECLKSPLPDDLQAFFFVNTDVGAPECARAVASLLAGREPGLRPDTVGAMLDEILRSTSSSPCTTHVVRGVVPRTFVDCNRILEPADRDTGLTPSIPEYVTRAEDVALLTDLHRRYQDVADRAYEAICGDGGRAVTLHTYAPRSVRIDRVDGNIVSALRRAYEPETYAGWEPRPDVDLITEDPESRHLAPRDWVDALVDAYQGVEVEARENATYRLHPSTLGHRHSVRYPGRVLCVELSRARLADPFTPFEEMRIGAAKVLEMAAPLALSVLRTAQRPTR
jgi:hypothetical protein